MKYLKLDSLESSRPATYDAFFYEVDECGDRTDPTLFSQSISRELFNKIEVGKVYRITGLEEVEIG